MELIVNVCSNVNLQLRSWVALGFTMEPPSLLLEEPPFSFSGRTVIRFVLSWWNTGQDRGLSIFTRFLILILTISKVIHCPNFEFFFQYIRTWKVSLIITIFTEEMSASNTNIPESSSRYHICKKGCGKTYSQSENYHRSKLALYWCFWCAKSAKHVEWYKLSSSGRRLSFSIAL